MLINGNNVLGDILRKIKTDHSELKSAKLKSTGVYKLLEKLKFLVINFKLNQYQNLKKAILDEDSKDHDLTKINLEKYLLRVIHTQ